MTTLEGIIPAEAVLPQVDLNRERREERLLVLRRSRRHLTASAGLILLACSVLTPLTLHNIGLHRQFAGAEREAAETRRQLQAITTATDLINMRINYWTKFDQTRQSRRGWSAAMPALAACLPDDVSLQQVQIAQHGKDAQVILQGSAGSMSGLRAFTAALVKSTLFSRLHLDETTASHTAGASGLSFQLSGPMGGAPHSP